MTRSSTMTKLSLSAWLATMALLVACTEAKVRVFLVAGASNVRGKADVGHLRTVAQEPNSKHGFILDGDGGDFRTRSDVKIMDNIIPGVAADLSVGYGNDSESFGPELSFGWTLSESSEDPILMIKCGLKGYLGFDWRPPSADPLTSDPDEGYLYRQLVEMVHDATADISNIFEGESEFELEGLVWWSGWSDAWNREYREEYFANLIRLVFDLRMEFNALSLPVVIGELGQEGLASSPIWEMGQLRAAQRNVAEFFSEHATLVPTYPYVMTNGRTFDRMEHYYGRADTMMDIGAAFGRAMLDLVDDLDPVPASTPAPDRDVSFLAPIPSPRPTVAPTIGSFLAPIPSPRPTSAPVVELFLSVEDDDVKTTSPSTDWDKFFIGPKPSPRPSRAPTIAPVIGVAPDRNAPVVTPLLVEDHLPTIAPVIGVAPPDRNTPSDDVMFAAPVVTPLLVEDHLPTIAPVIGVAPPEDRDDVPLLVEDHLSPSTDWDKFFIAPKPSPRPSRAPTIAPVIATDRNGPPSDSEVGVPGGNGNDRTSKTASGQ